MGGGWWEGASWARKGSRFNLASQELCSFVAVLAHSWGGADELLVGDLEEDEGQVLVLLL